MKIINSKFKHNLDFTAYGISHNSCFLDIETLGLNRNKDMIYLVGVVYYDKTENLWNLDQYFAETYEEEKNMLSELKDKIANFETLITYNGDAFDLPYLSNRFKIYNIDFDISKIKSLDLYSIVRKNKQYLNLENYKLKTLERFIGIYREDIYSGRDCIQFYKDYLITKDSLLEAKILNHNYDDLFYMLDLFDVLDILQDKKTVQLKVKDESINLILNEIKTIGDFLIIKGDIESNLDYKINYYSDNFNFILGDEFLIEIEYKKGLITPEINCIFIYNHDFSLDIYDQSYHSPPKDVILLQTGKTLELNNIKIIIEHLAKRILITD